MSLSADGAGGQEGARLEAAAEWFAILNDAKATEAQRRQWQEWLAASEANRQAWQRVEQIDRQFNSVASEPAREVLQAAGRRRRRFLTNLGGLAIAMPLGWAAWQLSSPGHGFADMQTAVGEVRHTELPDGAALWMNTDTALALDYGADRRHLTLLRGEVFMETVADPRPLQVITPNGHVAPLGTRFSVRTEGDRTHVAVVGGRVAVTPRLQPGMSIDLRHGRSLRFDDQKVLDQGLVAAGETTWLQNMLVADDIELGAFLDRLARYRRGVLRYDAAAAKLRLVGAFPLGDTDRILDALQATLPIHVKRLTPWWVKITRR